MNDANVAQNYDKIKLGEVGGGGVMLNIHAVCLKVKGFCLFRSIRTEFLIYL